MSQPPVAPLVFAVASGKGGVGKTFFSVHLALLARMVKPRVLLIDGDLGLSNVEVAMGLHPRHHLGPGPPRAPPRHLQALAAG